MAYIGDFRLGETFDTKFCTVTTTGAPTTLAGTPVISAYVGNNVTQLTAGITLSVDFDSVTGLNNIRVVATSGNGYATASNYQLVITTGTVGGTSVVGYVVAEFSIENRSALMPTVAARTLDVSAGGEAGADWANIGSPTTAVDLSGTTIATTQKVDVNTIKTNAVVNGGTITFPTNSTLASTVNITTATGIDVTKWNGTNVSVPTVAGVPNVNVKTWNDLVTVALPLVPTTAGRTLDVSVGGEGGVDWANVGSPTTTVDLSGTTIAITQRVDVNTIKTNPVVNGGTVTFPVNSTLASTVNITTATGISVGVGGIAASAFAASAIDATAIAADAIGTSELAATAVTKIWANACTEPTAAVAAAPTAIAAVSWLLTQSRNKITQTATTQTLLADDAATPIAASTVSDDGVTAIRGEFA